MSNQNFFTLCRVSGELIVKRIRVNQQLQAELIQLFEDQRVAFKNDVDTEVEFNGGWNPDANELLTISDFSEADIVINAIKNNSSSHPDMNLSDFHKEPIKAIFTGWKSGANTTVCLQLFSSRQYLAKKGIPILRGLDGNTFEKLEDPLFTFDNKLVAVIENNTVKFKSFHNLKMVFDLSSLYREATDDDLQDFAAHTALDVSDIPGFIKNSDTTVRKLIHTINSRGVLDNYSPSDIHKSAKDVDINVKINNGKIVLPDSKADLKDLLRFLDDDLYEAALSGNRYITNSKKPV